MKIAIPVANGALCMHFGHCEQFAIVQADCEKKKIESTDFVTPPMHEPGVLPRWLGEMKVDLVIAGGMGQRAQQLFNSAGVKVLVGAPSDKPEKIVTYYMEGTLTTGKNMCDH